jgi:predicted transcriptional regulator
MDYDFKGMTVDELKQLKELTQQSLDYYKNILGDHTLQDSDKVAFQLCYDMMQSDMDEINDELELRK